MPRHNPFPAKPFGVLQFAIRLPRRLLVMFFLYLAPLSLASQQPEATISVNVKVVNVPATVRDKHGQLVSTLTKDDFVLEEDGRPQAIHYFSRDTDLPLMLGLLVDTSLSQRRVLEQERTASYSFLDQMLRGNKDSAFLIHFDHEVELLQDFTSSRDQLRRALDQMHTPEPTLKRGDDTGGYWQQPHHRGEDGGERAGTLLYDAVFLASDEMMKNKQGRKAIIILSDGVDRGSKTTLEHAIETAQRNNTTVYSILFADEESHPNSWGEFGGLGGGGRGRHGGGHRVPQEPRPDGKKILARISEQTGGRMFEVSKKQTVGQIYDLIAEELRNQYNLGYTPEKPAEGYHKIHLTTKRKDLTVQARDGYYGEQ